MRQPFLVPDQPLAIALTGAFVVVATDEAVFVYDAGTAQLVRG